MKSLTLAVFSLLLLSGCSRDTYRNQYYVEVFATGTPSQVEEAIKIIPFKDGLENKFATERSGELTGLMLAAQSNSNIEVISILINAGANVNARTDGAWSALMYAANHNPRAISALISAGANVNARNNEGYSPLIFAAANGHLEAVSLLLNAGADSSASAGRYGNTAMHDAARMGHIEVVSALLEAGQRTLMVNVENKGGATPLMAARDVETFSFLLNAGANSNARDRDGNTALHYLARSLNPDRLQMAKLLLVARANMVNIQNNSGFTPLHSSMRIQAIDPVFISLLLEYGASVHIVGRFDKTSPLILAVRGTTPGARAVISLLLKAGANVKVKDSDGKTALDYAKENKHIYKTDAYWELHDAFSNQ